jgi:hypothetical protein
MFFLRTSGYSWKEVARFLGTTANSAQVLFNKGLAKVRGRIMKLNDLGKRPDERGEADA